MAERTLVEAVNDALRTEMERDGDVLVLGEDVGRAGGVFQEAAGFRDRFGADSCVDTPLAEAGILGTAVGLCMAGWRPVCEMQYESFSYPCLDQLICHVGRYRWRTNGAMEFPLTVRMPTGGGVRAPELHEDSPEAYYVHTPGIKVAIPATPGDAKGLLAAADELEASAEVVDVRTLKPLDEETILASVGKTGRAVIVQEAPRVAGFGAEIAAVIAEKAILDLRAPVLRVTGFDVPYPYWQLEDAYLPSVARVAAARTLLEY